MGLTIVKQIVEITGGDISAESEGLGYGSLFIFSIPMDECSPDDLEEN